MSNIDRTGSAAGPGQNPGLSGPTGTEAPPYGPGGGSTLGPALVISLGPPTMEPFISMFKSYQEAVVKSSVDEQEHVWVQFERDELDVLFSRTDDKPSPVEEVLSSVAGSSVRIDKYERGVGRERGLWVGQVWIPRLAVSIGGELLAPWNKAFRDQLGAVLGLITMREWIGATEWGAETP